MTSDASRRTARSILTLGGLLGAVRTAVVPISSAHAQPAAAPVAASAAPRIRLNQIGFYPHGPKAAVVVAGPELDHFAVIAVGRGDTVFAGALAAPRLWAPSGETVRLAEFSSVTRPGRYVLRVAPARGTGGASAPNTPALATFTSDTFTIGASAARSVAEGALKAFYYQRVSTPLPATYAGRWARAAGHPDTAVLVHASAASPRRPAGTHISSSRGWYDAGDYNKYVVNSGISTYTLLAVADEWPAYATALEVNIPESGNALPDVLDEALWNLRWMRTMQDPADGGVYHKLTNPEFDPFVMPAAATKPRYVVQKGTAASLDFAAVAAQAARVVRRYPQALPGLADSLTREALAAWRWARQHPDSAYDQTRLNANSAPAIHTGDYGDRYFTDEFRWAASELYLTTRQDSFYVAAAPVARDSSIAAGATRGSGVPGWSDVGMLGIYSLAAHLGELPAGTDTAAVAARLLTPARAIAARARASAYGVSLDDPRMFNWGSNSVDANQGMLLMQAYRLTRDTTFLTAAVASLDYLLGRNATGYSFVTGYGARPPMHPHHRPSAADTVVAPVPGFLVAGPNPGQQDHCPGYPSRMPALSYVDSTCAYAANEVAINWNAPLVYLAASVDAAETAAAPAGTPTGSAPAGATPGAAVRRQPARRSRSR